ncbi:MAG: hypothetical protein Q8O99_00450 [bacterium]|nr:hypothetical protein [bacterium]
MCFFNRSTYEPPLPQVDKVMKAQDLPETIDEVSDDILKTALLCEITNKPFRIIPQELAFYRKYHLPLPRRHPTQRHLDRMSRRNHKKMYDRQCTHCQKIVKTTYAPERSEKVHCETCYTQAVY